MSIERIRSLIAPDMGAVDAVIREKLYSDVVLIRQVSEYIVNSGGKRLRPALVILSAGAFGYAGKHHHDLAAIVEFIHTATLLHDDVVDASELRRSKATGGDTEQCYCRGRGGDGGIRDESRHRVSVDR